MSDSELDQEITFKSGDPVRWDNMTSHTRDRIRGTASQPSVTTTPRQLIDLADQEGEAGELSFYYLQDDRQSAEHLAVGNPHVRRHEKSTN